MEIRIVEPTRIQSMNRFLAIPCGFALLILKEALIHLFVRAISDAICCKIMVGQVPLPPIGTTVP